MRTPICDKLGIEFPIFAFSHCRDVVAAVTNAGGFGVLGALAFDPEQLEIELAWIDDHVGDKPYGVDFAMPANYVGKGGGQAASVETLRAMIPDEVWKFANGILEEHGVPPLPADQGGRKTKAAGLGVDEEGPGQVDVSLAHKNVKLLVNALGPPPAYVVERAHAAGIWVGGLAGSVAHAKKQVAQGVDVIIAQGTEAGGHTGEISTMVLVPDVVDAVGDRVPVLAAGGIGCGRQMAAALALGAQGAWTGSIWLTVAEADTNPEAIENLLVAESRDAVRSRSMTGKPARQLRTAWTEAWERPGAPKTLPMPLQGIVFSELAHRVTRSRNRALSGSPVGQIVSRMNTVRASRDVVREMVEECVEAKDRLDALFGDA
jgi:NAD(P)H-dependent flavin oxidoreductase YrpB (nitropropane dioxygenase family)